MMDCHKTNRDELIDRYLRNELPAKEADLFEEHLLVCAKCRNELTEREDITNAIGKYAAKETFQTVGQGEELLSKRSNILWYVVAAASIALVIGLFFLNRDVPPLSSPSVGEGITIDTTKAPRQSEEKVLILPEENYGNTHSLSEVAIAHMAEYQVNPLYENQIGIHMRSANLMVESPADSLDCIYGGDVEFRFQGTESDSLYLAILNNQGEVFSEEKITSPHILLLDFSQGLYYWQLVNEHEVLYTGKIYVKN